MPQPLAFRITGNLYWISGNRHSVSIVFPVRKIAFTKCFYFVYIALKPPRHASINKSIQRRNIESPLFLPQMSTNVFFCGTCGSRKITYYIKCLKYVSCEFDRFSGRYSYFVSCAILWPLVLTGDVLAVEDIWLPWMLPGSTRQLYQGQFWSTISLHWCIFFEVFFFSSNSSKKRA